MAPVKLTIRRADGSWWIGNLPDTRDCGPYDSKSEAEDDQRGMQRFYNDEAADIPDSEPDSRTTADSEPSRQYELF